LIRLVAVERGFAIPTEESFAYETGPQGALYVGSPRDLAYAACQAAVAALRETVMKARGVGQADASTVPDPALET
jgi:hypothetical protein